MTPLEATLWLRDQTRALEPGPPVAHVYRPLEYAWAPHRAYLERYGAPPKRALLVGMNPGPWGMGQNGVPFGEAAIVRGWLGLDDLPIIPHTGHDKRPVKGWGNTRSEQSGKRLWGLLREVFVTPERALRDLLVVNHCPLLLYDDAGKNITPDKLRKEPRDALFAICDEGLRKMAVATRAATLIGVGAYAAERCATVAGPLGIAVDQIPHPSPASPLANKDGGTHWRAEVLATLERQGLLQGVEVR